MTPSPLNSLRRPFVHRALALLATVALLFAGFAQAAHFHKSDGSRGTETHLQCLLCLHADRWAGPPDLPRAAAQPIAAIVLIIVFAAGVADGRVDPRYEARGPPHRI